METVLDAGTIIYVAGVPCELIYPVRVKVPVPVAETNKGE